MYLYIYLYMFTFLPIHSETFRALRTTRHDEQSCSLGASCKPPLCDWCRRLLKITGLFCKRAYKRDDILQKNPLRVTSHIWTSHAIHVNESHHTYTSVMSHIPASLLQFCHSYNLHHNTVCGDVFLSYTTTVIHHFMRAGCNTRSMLTSDLYKNNIPWRRILIYIFIYIYMYLYEVINMSISTSKCIYTHRYLYVYI